MQLKNWNNIILFMELRIEFKLSKDKHAKLFSYDKKNWDILPNIILFDKGNNTG